MKSTPNETIVAVAFIAMITIFGVGALWFGSDVINHRPPSSVQTASATTDYFSWSCQQLQNDINYLAAKADNYGSSIYASIGFSKATLEAQIMQLKGCSVSP